METDIELLNALADMKAAVGFSEFIVQVWSKDGRRGFAYHSPPKTGDAVVMPMRAALRHAIEQCLSQTTENTDGEAK